jgi:hypothetical protein
MPSKKSDEPAPISKKWKKDQQDFVPLPGNKYAREACKSYRITVADFFVRDKVDDHGVAIQGQGREYRSMKSYSVYDALYDSVLKTRHKTTDQPKFSWYHVPANNVSLL